MSESEKHIVACSGHCCDKHGLDADKLIEDAEKWNNFAEKWKITDIEEARQIKEYYKNKVVVERLKKFLEQDAILVTGETDDDLKKEIRNTVLEGKE